MNKPLKKLNEDEIDEIMTAEAEDNSAWEKPIRVRRPKGAMNNLDEDQIARLPTTHLNP